MKKAMRIQVVLFKRDLRASDHRPLTEAAARGPVLPLFVVEPSVIHAPDFDPIHWSFVRESLADLASRLANPLQIRVGEMIPVLDRLIREHEVGGIWAHEETGNAITYARDRALRRWSRARGVLFAELPNGGVVRRLRTRDDWSRIWEDRAAAPLLPVPTLEPIPGLAPTLIPSHADLGLAPDRRTEPQAGGTSLARELLDDFLARRARTYRRGMSSPNSGFSCCSRLSPHLAWGTLSLREIVHAARERHALADTEGDGLWAGAMTSFESRLHWRDHFIQKLEDEPAIEFHPFVRGLEELRADGNDPARFDAWRAGATGFPLVDACMRALAATGYLNFRMRAMVTAFASYHLWLDWRLFHPHLATHWTDYDLGIHVSQLQMQSGTTGINALRMYNPVKQSLEHDPEGRFVRSWVPELRGVTNDYIHEPWLLTDLQRERMNARAYPDPIVNLAAAAHEARDRIAAFSRRPGLWEEANEVQLRHGSHRGQRPPVHPKTPGPDPQFTLAL